MMITIYFLAVVLVTPQGEVSQSFQPLGSKQECQAYLVQAVEAMKRAPNGYKLVSAECVLAPKAKQ